MEKSISAKDYNKIAAKIGKGGKKITEETAEKKTLRDFLNLKGFFFYHNLAGMGVFPGIADYIAIKQGYVFQLEVKKPKGGVQSENQKKFQENWERMGGNYICGCADQIISYLLDFEKAIK